jgi:bifunctional UDP-N-acetylglucosamine pyrophosphorylase/glucosamine-1-phosphate N-acetyltransferase
MRSNRPKVLHEILGRAMIAYVLNAARYLDPWKVCVVVGSGASEVEGAVEGVAKGQGVSFVTQAEQLGSGHAALQAGPVLGDYGGPLVILPGDAPLISPQTLLDLLEAHRVIGGDLSVLTVEAADPGSYGRVVRGADGWLDRIVESRDLTPAEAPIREVNSGVYVGSAKRIFEALRDVRPDNAQGEYYLTDVVALLRAKGLRVAAVMGPDPQEIQGVNDREDLWKAREILRLRILDSWLKAGVTMDDPYTTVIEPSVRLERDVTLGPGAILRGATKVCEGASVGPYAVLEDALIPPGGRVPPHAYLRGPGRSAPAARGRPRPPRHGPRGRGGPGARD